MGLRKYFTTTYWTFLCNCRVYAAQLDSEDCKEDIDSIMALLNSDASFSEEHLLARDSINKFQNSMEKVNPLNAVESATKVLTPELRQKAFMIAAQIGKAIQEMRYAKILECFNNKTLDRKRICWKNNRFNYKKRLISGNSILPLFGAICHTIEILMYFLSFNISLQWYRAYDFILQQPY